MLASLPDPGQEAEHRERMDAFRVSKGPMFNEIYLGDRFDEEAAVEWGCFADQCPICRCVHAVEHQSFSSYGGTTEGWTACKFCGYAVTWADLSAVI